MMLTCTHWNCAHFAASLVIVALAGTAVNAESQAVSPGERIPDTDNRLTREELRWCTFEPVRLDGVSSETDSFVPWEVDNYNTAVDRYNLLCSTKEYSLRDLKIIEQELDTDKHLALHQYGADGVRRARAEREARRLFVKDKPVTVRTKPNEAGKELGLERWLRKTGHCLKWISG